MSLDWSSVRQKVVEWGIIALLGFAAGAYAEFQRMKIQLAQDEVYIDLLWKQQK